MKKNGFLVALLLIAVSSVCVGAVYVARFILVSPAQVEIVGSAYELGLFNDAELTDPFVGFIVFDGLVLNDLVENRTSSTSQTLFVGLVNPGQLDVGEVAYVMWLGDEAGVLPSSVLLECELWNSGGWTPYPEGSYDVQLTEANPSKGIRFSVEVAGTEIGIYDFEIDIEAAESSS